MESEKNQDDPHRIPNICPSKKNHGKVNALQNNWVFFIKKFQKFIQSKENEKNKMVFYRSYYHDGKD